MHPNKASRNTLPYTVFADGRLVARAHSIPDLFHALKDLSDRAHENGSAIVFSDDFLAMGPSPRTHVEVFDARGVARPELSSWWSLHRQFDVPAGKLHRAVDHGWDADHRPRGLPIPGTGRHRYGRRVLRRPATQSERRQAFVCSENDEPVPTIRPHRRAHLIPTSWEDDLRSDYGHRSWKRHRKTQWKPKPGQAG